MDDVIMPEGVNLYDPDDFDTQRRLLYDDVRTAVSEMFPAEYNGVRVELDELDYDGPETYTRKEQKEALMKNRALSRRLRATVRLKDMETGEVLDETRQTLLKVPVLTDRGTYIDNGNEIGLRRQARLMAGPYSRVRDSGDLETFFNTRVGTGKPFRVRFEPESTQYKLFVSGSNLHLYSLLHDLGIDDRALEQAWGSGILDKNKNRYDHKTLDKAYTKFLPKYRQDPQATREDKIRAVREALDEVQVMRRVAERNLPNLFDLRKSAAWRKETRTRELIEELARASFEKRADFSNRELDRIVEYLNGQGANIPLDVEKGMKEELILDFVQGQSQGTNPALAQVGREGLKKVQQEYDL